ncbi:glycosyltransferase [Azonexus sp. IMCC34842]|uniref:glycosyltransferase n=1 Tax=Azonexus sp. IMCC34842 TaxID=3420950 RepID=UPI003D12358D
MGDYSSCYSWGFCNLFLCNFCFALSEAISLCVLTGLMTSQIMKQLHIVQSIASDFGGLGLAALRYAQALALSNANISLFVVDRSKEEISVDSGVGAVRLDGGGGVGLLSRIRALKRYLDQFSFDVVHIHGTWTPILVVASYLASIKGIPVVVSPHGCLEPWALQHRGWKKKLALALYQKRVFSKASMIVATARQELESIRRLGIETPVAVIPNGVDMPPVLARLQAGKRKFLFLSRIHPKKGLPDLVAAWALVRQPGWQVVIAGPDEDGHLDQIRAQVDSLGLRYDFEFTGLVTGERKEALFAGADVFVLPTYSENFGIAVAEALARGVPVITTTGAPWEDIESRCCGWWVQPGVDGIACALVAAMNTPREELSEMGQRGILLVKEKYAWDQIGRSALGAYQWMLGQSQQCPDFVHLKN